MELNISELDSMNTMNPYEVPKYETYNFDDDKYWENVKKNEHKKKKITFNDILSNMNLVVNKDGVLQYMALNKEKEDINQMSQQSTQSSQYNQSNKSNKSYSYNETNSTRKIKYQIPQTVEQKDYNQYNQNNSEPIDTSVKHSYIYNKYFKDYVDPGIQKQAPRVPKTIEEYNQMVLEDKINAIKNKQRIEQIKSKKMFFTSVPGSPFTPKNITASRNNLRSMNFR